MAPVEIRSARLEDFSACFALGERTLPGTPYERLGLDRASAHRTLAQCLANAMGFAQVATRDGEIAGFLLGVIDRWAFGSGRLATDLIFVIEPGTPGAAAGLLKSFLAWAAERRALPMMGISSGMAGDAGNRFYESLGLTLVGGMFVGPSQ